MFIRLLITFVLLTVLPVQAARQALVIGNDNYTSVSKLQKAGNDATAMARELKAAGFAVQLHRDLNYRGMVRTVETFTAGVKGGDEVVVFFAGHGVQMKNGAYLLPTDIEATTESEVEKTAYELNALTEKLSDAKAAFSLVMVDACRNNPLKTKDRTLGNTRGLNAIEPPKGQMVVYSASKGQTALDRLSDKDMNPNSVFTREFIARMKRPGVRIEDLVREVQDAVEALAGTVKHEQRPALYNEARGNFYFFGPTALQAAPSTIGLPEMSLAQREDTFWGDAKAAGNKEAFQAYLDSYPRGRYASLAKANLTRMDAGSAAPASPVVIPVPPRAAAQSSLSASQVPELQKKAQSGNVQAMGELCEFFIKKNRDPAAALIWCQKGAQNKNIVSIFGMGALYFTGTGVTKNVPKAIEYAEQVASSSDFYLSMEAHRGLGGIYLEGEDVPQDTGKALKWLLAASERGDEGSQSRVISIYATGRGIPKDLARAEELAATWASVNPEKMVKLANVYGEGEDGIPQDKEKAKIWLDRSAVTGSAKIIMEVAWQYSRGKVVTEDKRAALLLYLRLAEKGNAEAQDSLGNMYFSKGSHHDVKKGAYWFQKAAEQGYIDAQVSLGNAYIDGEGVPKNSAKGVEWLNKAASQGNRYAWTSLGGYFMDKDPVLAYAWLNLASVDDGVKAKIGRDMVAERMSRQQIEEAERLSASWKKGIY